MTDYTPTDEQIEALHLFIAANLLADVEELETRAIAASPAFQSIVRSAQEEAWDSGYDRGFYDRESLSPEIRGRDASEGHSSNPFDESSDV